MLMIDRAIICARQSAVARLIAGPLASAVDLMLRDAQRCCGDMESAIAKLRAQRCAVVEYRDMIRAMLAAHTAAGPILAKLQQQEKEEKETEKDIDDKKDIDDRDNKNTNGSIMACDPLREALQLLSGDSVASFITAAREDLSADAHTPLEFFAHRGFDCHMAPHAEARDAALAALDNELTKVRLSLRLPGLSYRTISGIAFVIDVPRSAACNAPSEWTVLSRTRTHVRFHTPVIIEQSIALCAARERLALCAAREWRAFQCRFAHSLESMGAAAAVAAALAEMDALRAIGIASAASGYVAPHFAMDSDENDENDDSDDSDENDDSDGLHLIGARHPLLDILLRGGCVGCDVSLRRGASIVLTGPNMGGKSALMRMLGSLVLMAQVGCRVPATYARLPVFKAIYTRMGSSDALLEERSTFLSEMAETSRILHSPRLKSALVLLDELGRGTSSFDGIAVAAATLEFLVRQRATAVFVTHYAQICEPYEGRSGLTKRTIATGDEEEEKEKEVKKENKEKERVVCYFMGFREERNETAAAAGGGGEEYRLVFTYKPTRGVAPSSFGVRVAKMAGLPQCVVAAAQRISEAEALRQEARSALQQLRQFSAQSNEIQ